MNRWQHPKRAWLAMTLSAFSAVSCVGTTGGDILDFAATASGIEDESAARSFVNNHGYRVELERARLHVGAVYLNRSRPTSVSSDTSCTLPGIYVAELRSGVDLDLLSSEPEPFPELGAATSDRALTGEVWLTHGDVNAADPRPIFEVSGTAAREGVTLRFSGSLPIDAERVPEAEPGLPGGKPICKERIASPIPLDLTPSEGGTLHLTVDVRGLFAEVDFADLAPAQDGEGALHFATARGADPASDNLYAALRRSTGVYRITWEKR